MKIEIDDYKSPNQMLVVSIEGDTAKAKKVYQEFIEKYHSYILKEES